MMKMCGWHKRVWLSFSTAQQIILAYIWKIFLPVESWVQKQLPRNPRQLLLMVKNIGWNFIILMRLSLWVIELIRFVQPNSGSGQRKCWKLLLSKDMCWIKSVLKMVRYLMRNILSIYLMKSGRFAQVSESFIKR